MDENKSELVIRQVANGYMVEEPAAIGEYRHAKNINVFQSKTEMFRFLSDNFTYDQVEPLKHDREF